MGYHEVIGALIGVVMVNILSIRQLVKKYEALHKNFLKFEIEFNKLNAKLKRINIVIKLYKIKFPNWKDDYKEYLNEKNEYLASITYEYINAINEGISNLQKLIQSQPMNNILLRFLCATEILLRSNLPRSVLENQTVIDHARKLLIILKEFREQYSSDIQTAMKNEDVDSIYQSIDYRLELASIFWSNR